MITAWILYALVVGVLIGVGALVLEHLLRAHKLPTRWVWAGALALSVLWPLGHLVWKYLPRGTPSIPVPDPVGVAVLEPLAVQVTRESFLRSLDGPILGAWAAATVFLLLGFIHVILRTRRIRKSWKGEQAAGRSVLFSPDTGPGVVGYLQPQIVLPAWCREVEEHALRLILDHEQEHVRAGDLRLMITAGLLPILLPWHLPVWWQCRRLRLAAEGDCDLRVLRNHPGRSRAYMELLLSVGGKPPGGTALVTMLSEPEETLARRIRIMTMPFPKKPWIRGLLLAALCGTLVAVACWAPTPSEVTEPDAETQDVELPPPPITANEVEAAPTFTPFTVRPDIKNRGDVARALEEAYPPLLRDAGIGGTAEVWFFIDETGGVRRAQINESSGHEALDQAALEVARAVEFTPAMNKSEKVPVWISLPITFTIRGSASPKAEGREGEGGASVRLPPAPGDPEGEPWVRPNPEEVRATPTFTPYTVRPDIKNRRDVAQALEEAYPPLLREAGIGGTAHVWIFIDETGTVGRAQINESSGHEALDQAALEVARAIVFTPALNRDKKVPVWISLPITFTTR